MFFTGPFLESFSFPMNVYERVGILLAFHAFTPGRNSTLAARILMLTSISIPYFSAVQAFRRTICDREGEHKNCGSPVIWDCYFGERNQ